MKRVTVRLSELKPNPYKKFIQKGEIDEDVVKQIVESAERTSLWEQWVAREANGGYQLAFGHNRLAAAKKVLGGDAKVSVQVEPYSDEQMYIALADENAAGGQTVAARVDTVMKARELLKKNPEWCKVSRSETPSKTGEQHEHGSVNCIVGWLGKENWSRTTVGKFLQMGEGASPEVLEAAWSKSNVAKPGQIGEEGVIALSTLEKPVQEAAVEALKEQSIVVPSQLIEDAVEEVKQKPAKQQAAAMKRAIDRKAEAYKAKKEQKAQAQALKGKPKTEKQLPDIIRVIDGFTVNIKMDIRDIKETLDPVRNNLNTPAVLAALAGLKKTTAALDAYVGDLQPKRKEKEPIRTAHLILPY